MRCYNDEADFSPNGIRRLQQALAARHNGLPIPRTRPRARRLRDPVSEAEIPMDRLDRDSKRSERARNGNAARNESKRSIVRAVSIADQPTEGRGSRDRLLDPVADSVPDYEPEHEHEHEHEQHDVEHGHGRGVGRESKRGQIAQDTRASADVPARSGGRGRRSKRARGTRDDDRDRDRDDEAARLL